MDTIFSFGYWVRRRRMALDLTQRQLAERVGCALITLKKIEADERRPSVQMAELLADSLQIPITERPAFVEAARGLRPVDSLAPTSGAGQPQPRDAIPPTAAPLIGREAELAKVLALLDTPDVRLVSLIGPGGIGKTRLALAVARALRQHDPRPFPQGIIFVDLAAVTSATDLPMAMASALGISLDRRGHDQRSPEEQLLDYLRQRDMLFILDNVEQIAGLGPVLNDLLRKTVAIRLLVTSREGIGLTWEQLVVLTGLPYPSVPVDPQSYAAGQLFVEQARRLRSEFEPVAAEWTSIAELCALVDGMPLALELSGAWIDTLGVAEIVSELQQNLDLLTGDLVGRSDRHHSIRAVWDSTWQRLSAGEKDIFSRLCIFQGGFTRAAAEAVSNVTLPELAALVSRCLITYRPESGRYRTHELLRQFGLEQLVAVGLVDEMRDRHLVTFVQWAGQTEPLLHGPEQLAYLIQFNREQDNLRLALDWGLAHPRNMGRFVQLVLPLHWYWRIRSHVREGRKWTELALAQPGRSAADEATLQFVAGHMAWMSGDFALARQYQMASLAYWNTSARPVSPLAAHVHVALGLTALHQGQPAESVQWHETGLAMFRELGDAWGEAFTLGQLGLSLHRLGDTSAARVIDESLAKSRALGDPFLLALFLHHAAIHAQDTGDLPRAVTLAEEAARYERATGHIHSLGQTLMMLGRFAMQRGDREAARSYWQEALALFEDMGHAGYSAETRALLG